MNCEVLKYVKSVTVTGTMLQVKRVFMCTYEGPSKVSWHESSSVTFTQAPFKLSSRSSTPSPTPLFSVDPVVFKATSQSNAVVKTDSANTAVQEISKAGAGDMPRSSTVTTSPVEVVSSSRPLSSGLSFAAVAVAVEKRETASQTCSAPKRQMPDSDDNADDDEIATPLFVNKKQRIQNADFAQQEGNIFCILLVNCTVKN